MIKMRKSYMSASANPGCRLSAGRVPWRCHSSTTIRTVQLKCQLSSWPAFDRISQLATCDGATGAHVPIANADATSSELLPRQPIFMSSPTSDFVEPPTWTTPHPLPPDPPSSRMQKGTLWKKCFHFRPSPFPVKKSKRSICVFTNFSALDRPLHNSSCEPRTSH